jgi:hypothetical protein
MVLGRVERLQIMLTADELAAVDDWRFVRRMPSRASAIRELLKRGLIADGFMLADKDVKSKDFGLLTKQKSKPVKETWNHIVEASATEGGCLGLPLLRRLGTAPIYETSVHLGAMWLPNLLGVIA